MNQPDPAERSPGAPPPTGAEAPDVGGRALAGADAASGRGGRSPLRLVLVGACAILLVASVVVASLSALELRRQERQQDLRASAASAARQTALNLTSVDTEGFVEDVKRVLDGATGDFKTDFQQRSKTLQKVLVENQVRSQGKVLDAGVVRADEATAVVLVVVDATVRNRATPKGRVNVYRMQIGLERHGDRWLAESVEFVG